MGDPASVVVVGEPVLRADGIAKHFGGHSVLDGVDLHVDAGECVAVVGENGAGKSTLLRICAGVLRADRGRVTVRGRLGYCPQNASLFDRLSADEHLVLFGAGAGLTKAEALAQGGAVLDELSFRGRGEQVRMLSGGSRQKLNLALSLLGGRDVLLLDEPYQGFDHGTYVNFWDHVGQWRDRGQAVVVVTHMLAEVARVDRVVEL